MKPIIIRLSMSNIFLLPCMNGYLQIDTGYPHDFPLYLKGLTQTGIELSSIRYLLLTHHHDDHAGFLNELVQDTDVTIIAHELAKDLLLTGKNDMTHGGGYANGLVKFFAGIKMRLDPHWTLTFPSFSMRNRDILLAGDDDRILRSIGIPGRILYTPGHCIDHLVVVLEEGEVFCGDAASSFLIWLGTHYCTVFMTDMKEAYESWTKMLNAGARMVYPAHGRPFPAEKLRQNLGRVQTENLARFF